LEALAYGIFIGYTFTPRWLAMDWEARERFQAEHLTPVLAKYADRVAAQHFDAEAFSARPTDFMFLRTDDLRAYYFLIEELRETPLFSEGLAEIDVIHVGLADGYRDFAGEVLTQEQ
jgi:hypothetical protein